MTTSKAKYRTTQVLPLVEGEITYTPYDFKIMAMYKSDDGVNYTEITDRMPSSGYVINESKSYCTIDNVNHDNEVVLKTVDGNHVFNNLTKLDKCYIWFDKKKTGADTILANVTVNSSTPTFSSTATTDEGVFKTTDPMYGGDTYYWRGAVTNNYVKFAGFCWRIIRINGDKSIRMIYNGSTCHVNGTSTIESLAQPTSGTTAYQYNASRDQANYVGWTYSGTSQRPSTTNNDGSVGIASNAKTQLQTWYNNNLASYADKITDGKYCNDREGSGLYGESEFYYAGHKRLASSNTPTFNCTNAGDVYTLKVGLITSDEVAFAGGVYGKINESYYLYSGQHYWTMSPCNWDSFLSNANVFYVDSSGYLNSGLVSSTYGLRPVINLRSDVTFKPGTNGTQNSPYIVE